MSKAITFVEDTGISALSTVLNPVELHRCLSGVIPSTWGRLREVEVQVLKHHQGKRCTVEIALQTTTGKHELIGKVYAKDRTDVYRAMNEITHTGFGPKEEFSIPQPLAYLPWVHLLLFEKVQGPRAKDVLVEGNEEARAKAAQRCALWLARFHAAELQPERSESLSDQLMLLERMTRQIVDTNHRVGDKARRLYNELAATTSELTDAEPCAGHGSYSARQIIFAEGRTTAIDWDGYDRADPARDVARFIIEQRRLAHDCLGSIRALDAVTEVFLKTYLAAREAKQTVHFPYYEAATCLRIAGRFSCGKSQRPRKVEMLLNEGLRIMEQRYQCHLN